MLIKILLLTIKIFKKIFFISVLLVLFFILSVAAYRFDNYVFYTWEAQIRWGHSPFDAKKFQEAPTNEKAQMVSDVLQTKYFLGQKIEKVKKDLGKETGSYYNTESNLTYEVYKKGKTTWDIIFVTDYKSQKVRQVFAYRQRGGITRTILYGVMWFVDKIM